MHNFQAASRTGLPQLWIWTHGGQQCVLRTDEKNIYIQEKSISVTFEGTEKFIYLFYIWSDKLAPYLSSLSLTAAFLPARHVHASSAAFNLNSHAPFHFFLASTNSFAYPFSRFGPIRRPAAGLGSPCFARRMKEPWRKSKFWIQNSEYRLVSLDKVFRIGQLFFFFFFRVIVFNPSYPADQVGCFFNPSDSLAAFKGE